MVTAYIICIYYPDNVPLFSSTVCVAVQPVFKEIIQPTIKIVIIYSHNVLPNLRYFLAFVKPKRIL